MNTEFKVGICSDIHFAHSMDFVSLHSTGISLQNSVKQKSNGLHLVNHLNLARDDLNDFTDVDFWPGLGLPSHGHSSHTKISPPAKLLVFT